jgi:thiamine-phosphate pyrophosphorylase
MPARCLLYYITDRTAFPGDESLRLSRLLEKIAEAARAGVDYIQLREKDLSARYLEGLAREAVRMVHKCARFGAENGEQRTALLINSRTDVALAVQADGVHLRSDDIAPEEVRTIWQCGTEARENSPREPVIAVSCHSAVEVTHVAESAASFAVFAPVFEKKDAQPAGVNLLREVCQSEVSQSKMPVLALGGITLSNAHSCLAAGAAGVAAIRLFQENDIAAVVKQLCG